MQLFSFDPLYPNNADGCIYLSVRNAIKDLVDLVRVADRNVDWMRRRQTVYFENVDQVDHHELIHLDN